MNSLKAITAGSVFIIVGMLLLQLLALFIAVIYKNLAIDYPFLTEMSRVFKYLVAIPVFLMVIFFGGYITAYIAGDNAMQHCLVTGAIPAGVMMWSALENASLTLTGMVMVGLMIAASIAGGVYWQRRVSTR